MTQRIKYMLIIFVVLACVNLLTLGLTIFADVGVTRIHRERTALTTHLHELVVNSEIMVKQLRVTAVTGTHNHDSLFHDELEHNRAENMYSVLMSYGRPDNEVTLAVSLVETNTKIVALALESHRFIENGEFLRAIELLHSERIIELENHQEQIYVELSSSVISRLQSRAEELELQANSFRTATIIVTSVLSIAGLIGIAMMLRYKTRTRFKVIVAVFLTAAVINAVLSATASNISSEKSNIVTSARAVTKALQDIERVDESLTRYSRLLAKTQDGIFSERYRTEQERNVFWQSMQIFMQNRVPNAELNMLIDLYSKLQPMRQIEFLANSMSKTGYFEYAQSLLFDEDAISLENEISELSALISSLVSTRVQSEFNNVVISNGVVHAVLVCTTLLMICAGLAGLIIVYSRSKRDSALWIKASDTKIIEKIRKLNIASRLIISFVLIALLVLVYIIATTSLNRSVRELNLYNTQVIVTRASTIQEFQRRFLDMRLILSESFLNEQWREDSNTIIKQNAEENLSNAYYNLRELSEEYIFSVTFDPLFPAPEDDSRLVIMRSTMASVEQIYRTFSENFFMSGNLTFAHENVVDYMRFSEIMIRMLRQILEINHRVVSENITNYQTIVSTVSIVALILLFVSMALLSYIMLRFYSLQVQSFKDKAMLVRRGDFDATLKKETNNEMVQIFTSVVSMFNMLIKDIRRVANQNKGGNFNAVIDESYYKGRYREIVIVINELISAVREAEKAVEFEKHIYLMLDATPMAITMFNKEMRAISCNKKAVEMFKMDADELVLSRKSLLQPATQPTGDVSEDLFAKNLQKAFEEGYVFLPMFYCKRSDGTLFPTEIHLVRVEYDEDYLVIEYINDITDVYIAKEKEVRAAEENMAKTHFLARMSHEIRTPMNAVLGIAELQLRSMAHPPDTEEAFFRIYNSSSMLLSILNDILDLSKLESGKMELVATTYDVPSNIADVVQLNLMYVGSKNIEFKVRVDENLPTSLIGDDLRIKQVINNLVSNAFKYTSSGEVILSFGVEPGEADDEINTIITIEDSGQGLPEEVLDKLFESEFRRYNSYHNRDVEGSGLGLSIMHRIVTLLQGKVEVESTVGVGTKFTVTIPQKVNGSARLGREIAESLQRFEFNSFNKKANFTSSIVSMPYGKVLVVDDVESNLYVIKGVLRPYKIVVETAESGYEAIERVEAGQTFDIIFMDHMMPGIDGIETTKAIRELGYTKPIVALTANAVKGVIGLFQNSGFDGYVSKPIKLESLNAYLMRFIYDIYKAQDSNEFDDVIIGEDINANTGVADILSSDELKHLMSLFLLEADSSVDIIESLTANSTLDEQALKSLAMKAHSLKTSLHNVGREYLSAQAAKIEDACNGKDVEVIKALTPYFLEKLKQFISESRENEDSGEKDDIEEDEGLISEKLEAIAIACDDLNYDEADLLVSELRKEMISMKTAKLLKDIETNILYGDFDLAAELARKGR